VAAPVTTAAAQPCSSTTGIINNKSDFILGIFISC
jgi:hypothetical protein